MLTYQDIEELYSRYGKGFEEAVKVIQEVRSLSDEDMNALIKYNRVPLAASNLGDYVGGLGGGCASFIVGGVVYAIGRNQVATLIALVAVVVVSLVLSIALAIPRKKTLPIRQLIYELPTWRAPNSLMSTRPVYHPIDDSFVHLRPKLFSSDGNETYVSASTRQGYRWMIIKTLPQLAENRKGLNDAFISKLFASLCAIAKPQFGSKAEDRLPPEEELLYLKEVLKYRLVFFGTLRNKYLDRCLRLGRFSKELEGEWGFQNK